MSKQPPESFDEEHTDELPILLETVVLDDDIAPHATPRHDDTAQHRLLRTPPADAASPELLAALRERVEQIPGLEAQILTLTDEAQELEQQIADKDLRLQELSEVVVKLRLAADESSALRPRLASQLAGRDASIAELTAAVAQLEQEAATRRNEVQQLRSAAESAQAEAETLRRELAARSAAPAMLADPALPETQQLREDHAALAAYIANRRTWWDEMQAVNTRLAARVTALEHELDTTVKRLEASDAFAARESNRAIALRAELVDYARRADALERELKRAHSASAEERALAPVSEPAAADAPLAATAAAAGSGDAAALAAPPQGQPPAPDAVDAVPPAVESIAQLEAEVEYKRQQVAAQLVELREREQRVRALTNDIEHARREVGALRTEADDSRSSIARLERAVVDKDRALEARDARIATLQEELKQRHAVIDKRGAADHAPPGGSPLLEAPRDAAVEPRPVPVLICLTGDAPRRFALTKKSVTIGRGPQCDLQVVTHFVSREHARLTLNAGAVIIEDLGSRNGVFVNSVRVERHRLQQGDLLTIGETQFRFVESTAH